MSKPNNDIASVGSLAGAFSSAFRHLMMNTDDMLPAQSLIMMKKAIEP